MVTIKISDLKKFISAAKHIKDTKLLPIYAYVKLDCEGDTATFSKANGISFVSCSIPGVFSKNDSFIIEEKTLFGFAEFSRSSEIKINRVAEKIVISDETKSVSCQDIDDNYPNILKKESTEQFVLDSEVLSSLFLAKSHAATGDREMRGWMQFVHITKHEKLSYLVAFNGNTSYIKSFKANLPIISIEPETISVISKMAHTTYSQEGNYDYFDCGEVAYGFIKNEVKCADLTQALNNLKIKETITVDRKRIVDFCEMIQSVNSSNLPPQITFETQNKKYLSLRFADASGNQTGEETIPIEKSGAEFPKLLFQPKNIVLVLKDLGVDKVKIGYTHHNFIFTTDEDKNYTGSVMELAQLK